MAHIQIKALKSAPDICAALSDMLIETVAHGGSVSFMHPLSEKAAETFWSNALNAADRGERIILGAFDGDALIGTVTLLLDLPPNQPHRAEIAKMMTRVSHRHRGIATALLREAEAISARAQTLAAGARHRRGRRRGGAVRADGIQADRIDSGLRAEAAWRPHRHADLLEAAAGSRAGMS